MTQTIKLKWNDPSTAAWLTIGIFLLANISFCLIQVFNKQFNPDELQHSHIAWLVARGDIVYRDFWEHHGPLYSLLNGSLVYLTNAEPSLRILFWSRLLSAGSTFGVMALIWLISRQLAFSRIAAFLAVAIFSSLAVIQSRGVEMRPDPLQTLFWIAGLHLILRNLSNGSLKQAAVAGALFSLAILSNAKSGIGPFFVVVFYATGPWLCGLKTSDIWRDLKGMIIGGCLTITPFIIYFWINEALIDFVYYAFLWNLELSFHWSSGVASELLEESIRGMSVAAKGLRLFVQDQLPFLLLCAYGAYFWVWQMLREKDLHARQRNLLFIIAAAGTGLGWLLDLYTQYYLMFLPLWSVLASFALVTIKNQLQALNNTAGLTIVSLIALISASAMLWDSVNKVNFRENGKLKAQKQFTEYFVGITNRDEPVGMIWSQCGGYMFNPNVGYYWIALSDVSAIIELMTGEHPHGQSFIDKMESLQVRYVIGYDEWATEGMSDEAMNYLRENFEYSSCLWTRKSQ
jgi:hypothetical protein